ncbi:hypothetical protein [Bacillus thuringiensis]|nr:hypothetical protein [Bacillus thuringiensis]
MQEVIFKEIGFSHDIEEDEMFFNNARYGIFAIYSINNVLLAI